MIPEDVRPARALGERKRARRRLTRNRVLVAVALLVAFAVGIALGQALHDNPRPGGQQVSITTYAPLTETTR